MHVKTLSGKTVWVNFIFLQHKLGSERMETICTVSVKVPKFIPDPFRVPESTEPADDWFSCPIQIVQEQVELLSGTTLLGSHDTFSANTGTKISLERALAKSQFLTRQDRREVWNQYFEETQQYYWTQGEDTPARKDKLEVPGIGQLSETDFQNSSEQWTIHSVGD